MSPRDARRCCTSTTIPRPTTEHVRTRTATQMWRPARGAAATLTTLRTGSRSRAGFTMATLRAISGCGAAMGLGDYHLTVVPAVGPPQPQSTQFYATQTGTNIYFGSKLIKNSSGFVYTDRLGSIGKYYPYGVERPSATANGKEKFATYFRDSETGLDYADQRYEAPGTGRFLTADGYIATGGAGDPSSWNRYAYTRGDPVNRFDPGGRCDQSGDGDFSATVCGDGDSLTYSWLETAAQSYDPSSGNLYID